MFILKFEDPHYFRWEDLLWLEFRHVYEIYHQGSLDVSLLRSCVL